jgi:hypothetical protein
MATQRITIRIEQEEYEKLEQWAAEQYLSVSQMLKILTLKALNERGKPVQTHFNQPTTEPDKAFTPAMLLDAITSDRRPTDEEIIDAAQGAGVDSRKLLELRDRLFSTNKGGKRNAK